LVPGYAVTQELGEGFHLLSQERRDAFGPAVVGDPHEHYFKNNITEEVIAELLFVSQSVISETISTLEAVIVKALQDVEPDLAETAESSLA
jgi:hypothetical protein